MEAAPQRGWWGRHWKWLVPTGCLGGVVLCAGFVTILVTAVFGLLKSSEPYEHAVAQAKAHSAVESALGAPLEEGTFVTGNIKISGASGQADMAIPISGPGGDGTIYVIATRTAGQWAYATLVVEIEETDERIDLLE